MNLLEFINNDEFNKYFKTRTYKSGQVIFNEADECDKIGFVISGRINIETFTTNGKCETINTLKENDLFGQSIIFRDRPLFLGTATATIQSKVAYLSKRNLLILLQNNISFLEAYLKQTSNEAFLARQKIKVISHKNIRDRIMSYFEIRNKLGIIKIKSVKNLSDILSLPRPSVSRELTKMEQDGLIERNRYIIKLK